MEFGANEDQAIATLLHDTIEHVEPVELAREEVGKFGRDPPRDVALRTGPHPVDLRTRA